MKTTLLSILVLTLISCDASTKEFIGSSWKVTELKTNGTLVKVTNDVVLTVKSKTDFSLQLDANSCFGTYTIKGKNKIKLNDIGCTEMCCDSDFSRAVVNALYKVSKINQTKDKVILSSGIVEITFVKVNTSSKSKLSEAQIRQAEETTTLVVSPNLNTQNTSNSIPKGSYIELYKSPCKGNCEEFYMKFYEDGTVYYTGKFNAQVQGNHTVKLATSKSKSLFKDFEESNFMSHQDKYDDEKIMDLQNTYLTYKGKKIQIRYKYNAPKELKALLEKVEAQAIEALYKLKQN